MSPPHHPSIFPFDSQGWRLDETLETELDAAGLTNRVCSTQTPSMRLMKMLRQRVDAHL